MPHLMPHFAMDAFESALSFAARLAAFHTGGRLTAFLRDIGIAPMSLVSGEPDAIARLAEVSGVEQAELERNTPVRVGKRSYRLRGQVFPAEFFVRPKTACCLACLQSDDARGCKPAKVRRHQWHWALDVVRTCPEHGIAMLRLDKDFHDGELHELGYRAPAPGAALLAAIEAQPTRPVSPLQTYVIGRLKGHVGPAWLDSQPVDCVVRASELLGAVLAFGPKVDLQVMTDDQREEAGRAGYEVMAQGADAVRDCLHGIFDAFQHDSSKPGPQKIFGRLYTAMSGARTLGKHGALTDILRAVIFDRFALASGTEILGEALGERRLHTVSSLASEQGLDPRTLRKLLAARGLVPSEEQTHHAFDAEQGRAVAATMQRIVTVISLPKALGCARPLADQLIDDRLLAPLAGDGPDASGRTRKAVAQDAIDELLSRVAETAPLMSCAPDNYVPLAKAAEKAKCRAVDILHLLFGGHLRGAVRSEGEGLGALHVDPVEVKSLVRDLLTNISSAKAYAMLRIPAAAGWALVDRGVLPSVTVMPKQGTHVIHRFDAEEVAAVAETLISEARTLDMVGMGAQAFSRHMRNARVRPAFSAAEIGVNLYHRADTHRILGI
ncbi:TniQ family protein [Tropicibacter oceani]|uniref:TniQ family protein n=1 Tax=Tropicibacter oceani TaxID=3058420 RepID=A0ABY8QKE1_9RHOB|nr:TniQ family protein [Tropicibacter oceani]WGW05099.1 TniQ family protein [Tropicibacter oceani]